MRQDNVTFSWDFSSRLLDVDVAVETVYINFTTNHSIDFGHFVYFANNVNVFKYTDRYTIQYCSYKNRIRTKWYWHNWAYRKLEENSLLFRTQNTRMEYKLLLPFKK